MAVKTLHQPSEDTWFMTFTCFNWIPLFDMTNAYDVIYSWFSFINERYQIKTHAFVIMPNHVHIVIKTPNTEVSINKVMANGKRFMAYELVKRLKQSNNTDILNQLSAACTFQEKAKGQLHKVFEASFDAKPIYTTKFLYQKLDYIHHNPVSGKWRLCDDFIEYAHSSAGLYYLEKAHSSVAITDYREFWVDTDLERNQNPLG